MFQGTVGRRNTKLRNESVISLYIWVAELPSLLLSPGGLLSFYLKLRSLRSYLCSALLSITNLINKIANKNRIINTKFSRRTWQNNACQLLLCTQYMLPFSTLSCFRAVVWAFVQQFSITTIFRGFLLGQPLKRSVHILYRLLAHMLSVGSLVLQSEDALQVFVFYVSSVCDCLCIVVLVQAVLKLLRVVVVVVK